MIHSGIIGPGLIWEKTHRRILSELHDEIHVAAVAARSRENQKRARQAYPDATIYSDARELIGDPEVEAVIILTPISLNAAFAQAALEAGKQVIVEKPLARSLAEAQNLYRIEEEMHLREGSAATLIVLEQYLYKALIPEVKTLLKEGEIGTPVSFERVLHGRIAADEDLTGGYGSTSWRQTPDFPLGNFFDGGIHEVALFQELFGPPREVFARGRSLRPDFGEIDLLTFSAIYPGDIQGTMIHSSCLGKLGDHFVIHGTKGALVVRDKELHIRSPQDGTESLLPFSWQCESTTMWQEILRNLREGTPPRYSRQKVLNDLAFMEALGRSLSSGASEPLA
ncbi:myo-inositol 2-dehydrogenase / D-chiro-inositol 1-dehydrogenase [Alkalispirochaeta americana]|uniref:Myo-inositol 2-dehydrogenase / D-chiro-inositol 1-dehydrogenase n=1 Tax=Alkalispirochaeta americana TaxID=159291 RepID=A0A1N6TKS9_9SPIO|nr:Gfo/Idh/MocA family oxidoreductase [Alkalispirochaeta americana]SIQ53867.1 myo-inositol 2-dehydrogenase / D-chiro-inositol 1-dehydrogenase [Alkalispirochaeta americana]